MKLRPFPLLSLLIAAALLVQGAPLPAAARTAPDSAEPAAPTAFSCDNVIEIPKSECEALVALYNSTNGLGWTYKTDWLQTNTPCGWHGVSCRADSVVGLDLNGCGPVGSIPPQLGHLTSLEAPLLHDNKLTGVMPPQLAALIDLQSLSLTWCGKTHEAETSREVPDVRPIHDPTHP